MDGDAFPAFVAARRPELLRTALLLTGDPASAEALVQRTLARCRPRLTAAADPLAAAHAGLAAATLRRPRLPRAEQVLEPARGAEHGRAARALRELPALTRAVVVLRWSAGLPAAEVAAAVRRPAGTVAAAGAEGLARLTDVLPTGYERDPAAGDDEDRVRALLARLAADPGPWQLDADAAVADVGRRRRATRRRRAGGLAVAGVLAVAVAVPLARPASPPPAPAPAATTPSAGTSAQPPPIAPRSRPVPTGPTRGSLAGDAAFLDAVRAAGWGAQEPPPPADRQVVFAADTPDGRVALVTGTVLEDFRGVWLTGPVGAPADQLNVHVPPRLGRDRPLTLVLGGPGPATLVVVAAPGDEVELSDRLQVGPRGTVARGYTAVDAPDGTAVLPVVTTAAGSALSVRVTREGRVVHRAAADVLGGAPGPAAVGALTPLRPVPALPDGGLVAAALTDLAGPLAVEPPALEAELLWSDALPGARPGGIAVVLARSPGGSLLVGTWARVGPVTVLCGVQTPPGAADVAGLTVARVCDLASAPGAPADGGRWLVVAAPVAGVAAEVLDGRDRLLATVPLSEGGAVVPLPADAAGVRVRDAAGTTVTRAPVAPMATEGFGDFGPGAAG